MIFRHVSFELAAGQAMILHGPNGSGKTTLLRVIAGLLGLMSGRLRMLGENDQPLTDETRDRAFHFVSHVGIVRSQMRVRETLEFHAALLGAPKNAVGKALDDWALCPLADHSGGMLSAGQRHRLALARLSLQKRDLWLLDEPLVALDVASKMRLNAAAEEHLEGGGIIIAASHEPFLGDPRSIHLGPRA
ncbi:MAG: heme ABC exporter ATP-binding protein CcmA [Alphaproteobacteria bacterium]|nr:heme ABC exporter ATP-binding protein CcmA [Alphaproteobacteria bacterium]